MNRLLASLCLGGLASVCVLAQPKLIRVPQDQPTVQAGINAAVNGDTVLVAEGTYNENILLKKKIVLGSRYILDGDTSHISKTILDGSDPRHPDSASVVLITTGTDSNTVVSGFTIQNGRGQRFLDNSTSTYWRNGGGIMVAAGAVRISHNIIQHNSLISSTDGVYGGGIAMWPTDGPLRYWIIDNNRIMSNTISTSASVSVDAEGGGVSLANGGRFTNNAVVNNSAYGLLGGGGGGILIIPFDVGNNTVELSNNVICDNQASFQGGGICAIAANGVAPQLTLTNNLISKNHAAGRGNAAHFNGGTYTLVNCTIADNEGPRTLNIRTTAGSLVMRIMNCIIWNPLGTYEIYDEGPSSLAYVSYSIVRGGYSGTGNLNVDPNLEPHSGYYFIRSETSPARNAGVQSATVGGVLLAAPSSCLSLDPWWSPPLPIPPPIGPHTNVRDANPDMGAHEYDPPVGVERIEGVIPTDLTLSQNYPNPFNPTTTIEYELPNQSHVALKVYDLLGQEVAVLVDEVQPAGYKSVSFDASGLPSGVYYYRLTAGGYATAKSLVLLK